MTRFALFYRRNHERCQAPAKCETPWLKHGQGTFAIWRSVLQVGWLKDYRWPEDGLVVETNQLDTRSDEQSAAIKEKL